MTSDGVAYDPRADEWAIPAPGGPVRFNFLSLAGVSATLRAEAKLAMLASLTDLPARTVHGDFTSLRGLFRRVTALRPGAMFTEVTPGLLAEHEAALPAGCRHLAGRLAVALRRWAETGAGGLSRDLGAWLSWAPAEAHAAGHAVRTCCPARSALRASERDALLEALHAAYGLGCVPLADYAMSLLTVVLALRPLQVACLKVGDLQAPSDPGMFTADLLVSRLKQRGGRRPRDEFTARGIVAALAAILHLQCASVSWPAGGKAAPDAGAPMFPACGRAGRFAPGFEGHLSATAVSQRVVATLDRLGALPCGERGTHVFPLRLRRTLATTLRDEGWSLEEISTLLDHTGRTGALAYIEPSAALGARLDAAMGRGFADLSAKFRRPNAAGSVW